MLQILQKTETVLDSVLQEEGVAGVTVLVHYKPNHDGPRVIQKFKEKLNTVDAFWNAARMLFDLQVSLHSEITKQMIANAKELNDSKSVVLKV